MRRVKLSLVRGDARSLDADVALIGSRSRLARSVSSNGSFFRRFVVGDLHGDPLCDCRLLASEQSTWSNTLALSYTSRPRVRERAVGSVTGAIAAAHVVFRPRRILILPLSCRNPESVALCTLGAIYQFHYFTNSFHLVSPARADAVEYVICDLEDVSPYERVLAKGSSSLWSWFDGRVAPHVGLFARRMDFGRLAFVVTDHSSVDDFASS